MIYSVHLTYRTETGPYIYHREYRAGEDFERDIKGPSAAEAAAACAVAEAWREERLYSSRIIEMRVDELDDNGKFLKAYKGVMSEYAEA